MRDGVARKHRRRHRRVSRKGRGCGPWYQTLMNEILRAALAEDDRPVTAKVLRRILREELRAL